MLGNITLVYPLEKLYNNTFQKNWDRTLDKIRFTSPGDLEEMDRLITRLERYYEISGIKKLSISLGTYPDEYSSKIKSLRNDMCETVARKFRAIEQAISNLIGDPESLNEYDRDRGRFDEALTQFRLLRAFYRRWKLDRNDYKYPGQRYDFAQSIKSLAYRLAKKRMVMMHEYSAIKKTVDYSARTKVLEEISSEVSKLFDWYKANYLNTDRKNPLWLGSNKLEDDTPWIPVDFLDNDPDVAPLERFRKVPSSEEMEDIQKLFTRFVTFYRQHELVDLAEIGTLSDFARFREYAANFSLYSDDAEERLKAGLMEQMLKLHQVMRDAKERIALKSHTERMLQNSFAMYFAPVDEIYSILKEGHISSEGSVHHRYSGKQYDNLVFTLDSDIKDGDVGFIFPATKVLDSHRFYQVSYNPLAKEGLSEANTYLHVFSHHPDKPLKIDIRLGVFIAPKNKTVTYTVDGKQVRESLEEYFRKFFTALSSSGSEWFESSRLHNWLSRHCIFYDETTRVELLNMLRNKEFVSIINNFTNRKFDNLSLAQIPGTLKPSEFYVTHRFDAMPNDKKEVMKGDTFNVTLFEWERKEE